ncbi:hypothetical protein D9M68_931630 [compost metagenome]
MLIQTGWLLDTDPLVLFALRGLDREELLAALHARSTGTAAPAPPTSLDLADDVALVVEAALRAQRLLPLFEAGVELPEGLL